MIEELDVTNRFAAFAATLSYDAVPAHVSEFVKLCIIDQIGVQLALSERPVSRIAFGYATSFGDGPSTIVASSKTAQPELAAFANAIYGHAFELDDVHLPSLNHPGPMVVASALASAEVTEADGVRLIEAVLCGYEVMGRIGRGLGRDYVYGRGFHPVGVLGPFGAAIAAGKVWRATQEQHFNAIGLAASHGGGTLEYNQTWGETTRLHAGLGAMGGVRSAALARAGMTGPGAPIAGKYGFARVHSDQCDFGIMVEGLGEVFTTTLNRFKLRPYHGILHAVIDTALECMEEADLPLTARATAIRSIAVGVNKAAMRGLVEGAAPSTQAAASSTEAQFSLHGPLANAILSGGTVESVWAFDPSDPIVRQLSERIEPYLDEECEREWVRKTSHEGAGILVRVRIELEDGRSFDKFGAPFDEPRPLNRMYAKFNELAERVLSGGQTAELLAMLRSLESVKDIRDVTRLLRV